MTNNHFKRQIEDFTCEHCGEQVVGNGYTNHCPKCLWSKHVDIHPGDRMADCGGGMEPVEVIVKGDSYILVHKCVKCGYSKNNKMTPDDSVETAVTIARKRANI